LVVPNLKSLNSATWVWNNGKYQPYRYRRKAMRIRRIKFVVLDGDGVIYDLPIKQEDSPKVAASTWNVLFSRLGIYEEHERLKRKFIAGEFKSYVEWTNAACKVLKDFGLKKKIFEDVMETRQIAAGVSETVSELRKHGIIVATISGSFEGLSQRAKSTLPLDAYAGHCRLIFDRKGSLSDWRLRRCDYEDKVSVMRRMGRKFGVGVDECSFVGHEVNDIPALKASGLGIALNAHKEKVRRAADISVKGDVTAILKLILVAQAPELEPVTAPLELSL